MVYLAFALCCLIWGSTFLAIRIGSETVAPVWGAVLRLALAMPALALLAWATRARWPRGQTLQGAILFGFFNYGVNLGLLYWGEQTVPSGIAAVFYATVPLSTALLGETRTIPETSAGWFPILYLVIAGSLGAYLLYTWLLKTWSVTNASYVGVIVPIVAVILGAIVKQERPAPLTFLGAAIVISAVSYALRPSRAAALPSTVPAS